MRPDGKQPFDHAERSRDSCRRYSSRPSPLRPGRGGLQLADDHAQEVWQLRISFVPAHIPPIRRGDAPACPTPDESALMISGPVSVVSSTGISISTVRYPFKISTVAGVRIGADPCSVEQFRRCRFARAMSNAVDMQVLQADRCADDVDDGIDRTDLMKMHFSSVELCRSPPPRRSRGRSVSPSISPVQNDPASMMVSMSPRWRWYFGCP